MAKIGYVQNGLKKRNGTKRKSNPLGLARVKGFAAKNGLKLVPKGSSIKVAVNPKRKRRRRNGLPSLTKRGFSLKRNGLFGNTKSDAKKVGSLLGGMLGGKALARVIQSFVAPYLSQVGLGNYAEILADAGVALTIAPFVAAKIGGADAAQFARLGALANVVVDVIEMVAPNTLSMFGSNPLVSNGQSVGLAPSAVAQLVANTSASASDKAKVAGVMAALESGNFDVYSQPSNLGVLPLYG